MSNEDKIPTGSDPDVGDDLLVNIKTPWGLTVGFAVLFVLCVVYGFFFS